MNTTYRHLYATCEYIAADYGAINRVEGRKSLNLAFGETCVAFTVDQLQEVDDHLGALTKEQMKILSCGEYGEAKKLSTPLTNKILNHFFGTL